MPPIISAIVCTHNRPCYLKKAINSLVTQTLPIDDFEILIIDNASQDKTKDVVATAKQENPKHRITYIIEPRLGLSYARNRGYEDAEGDYVAFLDDDAIADIKWLETIVKVFQNVEPQPGVVGGKIIPIWEAPQPKWLADDLLLNLTILDWSEVPLKLNEKQFLAGANIAFPRRLLEKTGGFKTNLGRKGNKLLGNEELFLRNQLERMGKCCYYNPEILVKHHIHVERLTQKWFLRRYFWQGVSDEIQNRLTGKRNLYNSILILALFFRIFLPPSRFISFLFKTENPQRFIVKCSTYKTLGYFLSLIGVAK